MATGWWGQSAYPTSQPYAGYLSYLDYVTPATELVTTPNAKPSGVMESTTSDSGAGGGSAVEGTGTSGTPNVGEAAFASANNTSLGGANTMFGVNSALSLLGVPTIATTLFAGMNALTGTLQGFNIDPSTGYAINSQSFQALAQGTPYGNFPIDFSSAALSPLSAATIGPLGANQAGFSTSPLSVGTPFSANPVQTARGDQGEGNEGNPSGVTAGNVSATAGISGISDAPGNTGVGGPGPSGPSGPSGDAGGPGSASGAPGGSAGDGGVMRRGGAVRDTRPGGGDNELRRLMAGEYVVRRSSAVKYRTLLDAINRDRPTEVRRLASKLRTRLVA